MENPQKPKYDKPYCWNCQGHSNFSIHSVRVDNDTNLTPRINQVLRCRDCGEKMSAPRNMDLAFYGPWGIGCLWIYFIFASAGLLWLAIYSAKKDNPEISWFTGLLGVILLIIPVAALLRAAKKYASWKQWAEEQGWKEPPREKRAWKNEAP
ncbi:MAG: hypothetical protein VX705_01410 [Verrucomicrobiota bacterium]|nr:hypothetical protein [Verrucomicrobiota bacterium]